MSFRSFLQPLSSSNSSNQLRQSPFSSATEVKATASVIAEDSKKPEATQLFVREWTFLNRTSSSTVGLHKLQVLFSFLPICLQDKPNFSCFANSKYTEQAAQLLALQLDALITERDFTLL